MSQRPLNFSGSVNKESLVSHIREVTPAVSLLSRWPQATVYTLYPDFPICQMGFIIAFTASEDKGS